MIQTVLHIIPWSWLIIHYYDSYDFSIEIWKVCVENIIYIWFYINVLQHINKE